MIVFCILATDIYGIKKMFLSRPSQCCVLKKLFSRLKSVRVAGGFLWFAIVMRSRKIVFCKKCK